MSAIVDEHQEAPQAGLTSMAAELEKLIKVTNEPPPKEPTDEAKAPDKTAEKAGEKTGQADKGAAEAKGSAVDKGVDAGLEDTTGFSPKASEKFNLLKASRDTERSERAKLAEQNKLLQQQIAEAKKTGPAESEEYAALRRENEELSNIVKVQAVERHPRFKAYFDAKYAEATAAVKMAAGSQHAERVAEVIRMPEGAQKEEAVEALLSELPPYRANQVGAALFEFQKIHQERAAEIAKAGESLQKLEAKTVLQTKEQQQKMETARTGMLTAAKAAAANLDGFKLIEGDEAHNKKVEVRTKFIDDFMHLRLDEKTVPMIPVLVGQALHLMDSVLPAKDAKIAALEKQIAQLTKASPGANGGDAGKAKESLEAAQENGFTATFKHHMEALGKG